jgi:pimeloyl-ACP methyl ester carboxylesterase
MPYAVVNDLSMYYEEHGAPDGPPLVLLHEFDECGATTWAAQLPVLGARYRVVLPDCRGRGRTGNPAGPAAMTHRRFARDTAALCRALGIDRARFCGASSGAIQLLTLALEWPGLVEALVLSAGAHELPDELRAWMRDQTPEAFLARRSPEWQTTFRRQHTALGPDHWRTVLAAFFALADHAHTEDFPEQEDLPRIQAPTLIVHGDRDSFFPVEGALALHRLLPNAELCVLPRTGHSVERARQDWFNAIVLDFLERTA